MSGISFSMGAKKGQKLSFGMKGQQKASKAAAVFAHDSDDDEHEEEPAQDQKRQRRESADSAGPSHPPPTYARDATEEEKKTAEKLADFVVKHGRSFEEVTRQRNPQGGIFKFLFDKDSPGYKFYEQRIREISAQQPGALATKPMPQPAWAPPQTPAPPPSHPPQSAYQHTPPMPHQQPAQSHMPAVQHVNAQPSLPMAPPPPQHYANYAPQQPPVGYQQPPAPAPPPGLPPPQPPLPQQAPPVQQPAASRPRRSRWQDSEPASTNAPAAPPVDSSTAHGTPTVATSSTPPAPSGPDPGREGTGGGASGRADDSVAAMEAFAAAMAKRDRDREEREAVVPLLNDTSFDRRRVMAVYKEDGSRGHHMQDYIPKEELAKLLAKSGSEDAKAQAEAIEAASRIQSDNIGHKLLSQMGWKEGEGLGASGSGLAAPVNAASDFGGDKRGLGAEDHRSIQQGDDEFEQYRKRMMLGYKHRPNPLGNPRKSYY